MFLSSSPGGAQIGRLAIIDFGHPYVEGTSRPRVDDVSRVSNVISKSVLLVFTQISKVLLVNVGKVSCFVHAFIAIVQFCFHERAVGLFVT